MRFLLRISILLLLFTSCQDVREVEKPKDLIPKEKMADILVEMSLVQSAKSISRQNFEKTGIHPREYIWEKFDIDSLQFVKSNNYYAANYRVYEDIYSLAQARMEALKVKYDSLTELERNTSDSIRAAEKVEKRYRDSILGLPMDPIEELPEAVSSDSISIDSISIDSIVE